MRLRAKLFLTTALAFSACANPQTATETPPADSGSISPYIDKLRAEINAREEKEAREKAEKNKDQVSVIPAEPNSVSPYIDQQRAKIAEREAKEAQEKAAKNKDQVAVSAASPDSVSPYLDSIREQIREREEKEAKGKAPAVVATNSVSPYIDQLQQKIGPPDTTSAIEQVKEGKSELKFKRSEDIHWAIGLDYNTYSPATSISAASTGTGTPFLSIYGSNYSPQLSFFAEWQPLHSETWGSLGVKAMGGLAYFYGQGNFAVTINNAITNQPFSTQSATTFYFVQLPATLGVDYRMNILKYVRPFAFVGFTAMGYLESRNDNRPGNQGWSQCLTGQFGLNILLDWMSKMTAWDSYADHGIKHTYLTVDYQQVLTVGGDVSFNTSSINAGMTFEF